MRKPVIIFLADFPNWAFDFVAKSISYRLRHKYTFRIEYSSRRPHLDPSSTDLLYVFFWGETWHKQFGFSSRQLIKEVASFRWKFDDKFGKISAAELAKTHLAECVLVTTPAASLFDELSPHVADLYLCPNGVEHSLYSSLCIRRLEGRLKIGWVGNPLDKTKGLADILIPATSGYDFKYTNGRLTRRALTNFYKGIDVLAIASEAESQPLPLLEGLASGCFPVATNVGIVPEIISGGHNGLVVSRTVEDFRRAFEWCDHNIQEVRAHRANRSDYASLQSWDVWALRFDEIFSSALSNHWLNELEVGRVERRIDRLSHRGAPYKNGPTRPLFSMIRGQLLRYRMLVWDAWSKLTVGDRFEQKGLVGRVMLSIGRPLISSLRRAGVRNTLVKVARYPFQRNQKDHARIFSTIYKDRSWGNHESASGSGSTLEYTANLREQLPRLFKEFSISSVYDAPCGDFNWMRHVVEQTKIAYLGADIVPEMIYELQERYGNLMVSFKVADIMKDKGPRVDLWMCRDCLFHLSNRDIISTLWNFLASGTPLFLTTTHVNMGDFENADIQTGGFRRIDLFAAPYFFPKDTLARIVDWISPWPPREMHLWTRGQVANAVQRMEIIYPPRLRTLNRRRYLATP